MPHFTLCDWLKSDDNKRTKPKTTNAHKENNKKKTEIKINKTNKKKSRSFRTMLMHNENANLH